MMAGQIQRKFGMGGTQPERVKNDKFLFRHYQATDV